MALSRFKQSATLRSRTVKTYDYLNRLQSLAHHPGSSGTPLINTLSYAYQYNDTNQRIRMTLADGSYWLYLYDDKGQVISGKRYWSDHTPVPGQQNEYQFDDIGNRTQTKSGGDANGAALRTASYTRNLLNQYSQRDVPSGFDVLGIANSPATVTITGSAADYRRGEYFQEFVSVNNASAAVWQNVSVTTSGGGGPASGNVFVAKTPELYDDPGTPAVNEGYDLDGNQLRDGRWTYTWDAENRLIAMQGISGLPTGANLKLEFEYDAQGRRISKKSYTYNGSRYVLSYQRKYLYDGWNLLAELDGSNNLVRSYLWGLDLSGSLQGAGGVGGLLASRPSTGAAHFSCYDGNGNVTTLVDGRTGTYTANYEYDPFGQTLRATGSQSKPNPFRFSTKYTDDETDLLYYGYRYYNASTGRWPNRDPIEEQGGLNLYRFVENDPVNRWDHLGQWSPRAHDLILDFGLGTTLKKNYLRIVQQGSRIFDEQTQAGSQAYLHSMREKNQDPVVAIRKRDRFVLATLQHAQNLAAKGRCESALTLLGEALHPVMDASSPIHVDQDGRPLEWDWGNLKEVKRHSPTEGSGEETARHLTNAILKEQRDQILNAYYLVFQDECPCRKKMEIRDASSD